MKRKVMSLLLVLVMALTLLPAQAWAADEADAPDELLVQADTGAADEVTILAEGTCGAEGNEENVKWVLNSNYVLTISGSGAMHDWDGSYDKPWGSYWKQISSVVVEKGVTSVGGRAFWCYDALTSVTLPESLVKIGAYAFFGCAMSEISIPDSVTNIDEGAFGKNDNLTSVVIPQNVKIISKSIFESCKGLTNVTLPDGVETIGAFAFSFCERLENITIPSGVERIEECAFNYCKKLTKIEIPGSVKYIGNQAFSACYALTSLVIGNGMEQIGEEAFELCIALTDIVIPASVTAIGDGALRNCKKLENISVAAGNTNYAAVNGVLFNKEMTELLAYPAGSSKTAYTIPETVNRIGNGAFYNSKNLLEIVLPNGLKEIGSQAFSGCNYWESLSLPNSVITIKESAFDACESFTSITLPNSVTALGKAAFAGCSNVEEVQLSDSLTVIEESVFGGCRGLYTITIPEGVTEIKDRAFYGCQKLWCVDLPSTLTAIGEYVFYSSDLTSVYYGATKANWDAVKVNETGNTRLINATMYYSLLPGCPTGGDKVQIQDVAFAYEYLTGQRSYEQDNLTEEQWNAMDVNSDETVDVYDLQAIYELAVGLR